MRKTAMVSAGLVLVLIALGAAGSAQEGARADNSAAGKVSSSSATAPSNTKLKPAWDESRPGKGNGGRAGTASTGGSGDAGGETVLTANQIHDALLIIHEVDPDKAQQFEQYLQKNPEQAREALAPVVLKLHEFEYLKSHNRGMYKLRLDDLKLYMVSQNLANQYHEAMQAKDTAKADQLASQLRDTVLRHFKLRQQIQEEKLAALEKTIADLKKQIELRKAAQDKLIDERYKELTNGPTMPIW